MTTPFKVGDKVVPKFVPIDPNFCKRVDNTKGLIETQDELTIVKIWIQSRETFLLKFEGKVKYTYDAAFFRSVTTPKPVHQEHAAP